MDGAGQRSRLLDVVDDGPMDQHADLVRRLLGCPIAVVTLRDERSERYLGMAGVEGAAAALRGVPADESLGELVEADRRAVQVDDLAIHDRHRRHPARTEHGVAAYLGVPLRAPGGAIVGAVAAVDTAPRGWTTRDLDQLCAMRDLVQVELRPLLQMTHDRARAEEVSLLLSTLRHELGGQLAVVLGGIETALRPGLDDVLRTRVLGNARRDCRRVVTTLDALLRVDSRAPIQLRDVALASVVDEVLDEVAVLHDRTRVTTEVRACTLRTEPTLLGHVLRNLIDNACKYSTGPVLVVGGPRDGGGPHARGATMTISDHGPGLPAAVAAQLYEPFSRPRTDGGASGFGLGLYIIRTLCDRLGAHLEVDSSPDGTSVTIDVPDARQSPKPSNAASSSEGA